MTNETLNNRILQFKKEFLKAPIFDIMPPTGIKELSKYKSGAKGTPIHIKSAQNYNKLLDLFKIESIPKFQDGDKIIWGYLKQNPYGFDTIALRGYDDPDELLNFTERHIDKEKIFETSLIGKIENIWGNLGWQFVNFNKGNISNFF